LDRSDKSRLSGWRTYRLFGLTLASDFPFVNSLPLATGTPDLRFTRALEPPLPLCWQSVVPAYVSPHRRSNGDHLVSLYCLNGCDVLRFPGIADFYLWPDRIVCHLVNPVADGQAELYLLGTVLAFWLERQGVAVLHAASIAVAGRAIAFAGSKRSGKSSLAVAFVQAGDPLLTDDLLSLRRRGDRFIGQPGYPQIRLLP